MKSFIKPYDILFFIILISMLLRRKYHLLVVAGLVSLILSMTNFAILVSLRLPSDVLSHFGVGPVRISFETAQHLTWYAGAFFLSFVAISILQGSKEEKWTFLHKRTICTIFVREHETWITRHIIDSLFAWILHWCFFLSGSS